MIWFFLALLVPLSLAATALFALMLKQIGG
jgi:hypothetical protein